MDSSLSIKEYSGRLITCVMDGDAKSTGRSKEREAAGKEQGSHWGAIELGCPPVTAALHMAFSGHVKPPVLYFQWHK